jgi:hypothetical protein
MEKKQEEELKNKLLFLIIYKKIEILFYKLTISN